MRVRILFLSALVGCSVPMVCRGDGPKGDAAPTAAVPAPAVPAATKLSLETTHVVKLKNGLSIRCATIDESGGTVRLALKPYGVFSIPRREIAEIREEAGAISVQAPAATPPRPAPAAHEDDGKRPADREEAAAAKPASGTPADLLAPPPIPPDMIDEVDYWIYHLSRERPHWRIRAERHLKDLGPIVVGPVARFYHHWQGPTWLYRCAALRILAAVRHPSGVPTLREALEDPHPIVRQVAAEGLAKLPPPGPPAGAEAAR